MSIVIDQHHNITANECWELTVFPENECWEMAANEILTYDEADYMAGGMSLVEARQAIATSECSCEMCNI